MRLQPHVGRPPLVINGRQHHGGGVGGVGGVDSGCGGIKCISSGSPVEPLFGCGLGGGAAAAGHDGHVI